MLVYPLAFHDCVGGCDGCINQANPANAGLTNIIAALETFYSALTVDISRADFWAIASIAAVNAGIEFANKGCSRQDPL